MVDVMKTLSIRKLLISILTAYIMISAISCKEEPKKELTGIVTFKIGSAFINEKNAMLRDRIYEDDIIKVKEKSVLVIQFSESALLTIKSNTTIKIAELVSADNKPLIELFQTSGSTFNKIVKGKANYRIKTPTSVASVRGTSFYVSVQEDNKSQVKLLHGELEVSQPDKETQPVTLVNEQKIETSTAGLTSVKSLDQEEQKRLEKFDKIEILPEDKLNETAADAELGIMPEDVEKILIEDEVKNNDNNKKKNISRGFTIPYLKKKYGNLSKIQTKDGHTYIGAFKQIGDKMEVVSTKGKFMLPVSKIKKVSPYE